ncbi:DUF2860 family protein [Pseudomonadota bacterium]
MSKKHLATPQSTKLAAITALVAGCTLAATTQAAVIIPEKSGLSGYVNLGAGGLSVKSNMLASIMSGNIDIGDKRISSLNSSPNSSNGGAIPVVNFELSYTFGSTRTQLHLGNLLEDYLSMDTTTIAGVRQDVGRAGQVGASYRGTTIKTEVWQDPYLTDAKRKDTDRTSDGFRVYWQQFMSSGLELRYTYSEIDIDDELSGQSLALTAAQRKLLDRQGDIDNFALSYEFASDDKKHIVEPQLAYIDRDLDGQAMANDGVRGSVNYIYSHDDHWRWVVNASYGDYDYKKANPIYDYKDKSNHYGASLSMFYTGAFGLKNWTFNATAGYFEQDNDLDFYDSDVAVVALGMLRRF